MNLPRPRPPRAFYAQAGISFAVAVCALGFGIAYLPVDPWMRAFLSLGACSW